MGFLGQVCLDYSVFSLCFTGMVVGHLWILSFEYLFLSVLKYVLDLTVIIFILPISNLLC
jgi:hypothetical protein